LILKNIMPSPIVIVPACTAQIGNHAFHVAQMKYLDAVVRGATCLPLVLPAFGAETDFDTVLATADGLMLTGAYSNVHPSHYQQEVHNPVLPQDAARDATTLPLIRAALKRGTPIFAVCRGFQEVNVALGGSLHQAVQEVEGKFDHREDKSLPQEQQYAPVHQISLTPNGEMAQILDGVLQLKVNSLHGQGIAELAPGLQVEARADDGLIEAYSFGLSGSFALAVQWHPEWDLMNNPASIKIFNAFGQACRDYQSKRGKSE
jgi:putative glutamine amidotransferase